MRVEEKVGRPFRALGWGWLVTWAMPQAAIGRAVGAGGGRAVGAGEGAFGEGAWGSAGPPPAGVVDFNCVRPVAGAAG